MMPKHYVYGAGRQFLLLLFALLLSSGLAPAAPVSTAFAQTTPAYNYGEALQKAVYFDQNPKIRQPACSSWTAR